MSESSRARQRLVRPAPVRSGADQRRTQGTASPEQAVAPALGNQALQQLAGSHGPALGATVAAAAGLGNQAVQRLAKDGAASVGSQDLGQRIRNAGGGGHALDGQVQRTLEEGLRADLSQARVHEDSEADGLARSVNALAFTSGKDIFFQSGRYNPTSSEGMHMLAHEAAHVVQQSSGPVSGTPTASGVSISSPGDSFERAADAQATRIVGGNRAGVAPAGQVQTYIQRAAEDEELQTYVQRAAEDEELQTYVQRAAEDEELQTYVQRASEDEELQTYVPR